MNIQTRLGGPVIPYTPDEYKFYINICLENQFFNDVQTEHYIDCGCICNACNEKRVCLFNDIKNGGSKINLKISHENQKVKIRAKKHGFKDKIYNLSSVIGMRK